jgi:3-dehydroquinate synthetase
MIIWLQGPSGAGKTTVGRRLAAMRGVPFVDLDEEIERAEGRSILDIFSEGGEGAFRRMEWNALFGLLDRDRSPKVVALGGGAVIDPAIRGAIRASGVRVTLDCDAEAAIARLETDDVPRPLLFEESPLAAWRRLHRQRARFYAETDISVDAGGDPDDVASRVDAGLRLLDTPIWTRESTLAGERSTVSSWRSLYALAGRMRELASEGPLCIVADASIQSYYPEYCDPGSSGGMMVTVEAGEGNKSLKTIEELAAGLARGGCTRETTIVGIGGGVVTDIAGFLASVYMRGVRSVYIPTTLLGQVDAAIGGKTAVNAAGARNLIGTFKQPEHVLIGSGFLRTLPPRELRSGFVESLKMGIANSAELADAVAVATPAIIDGEIPANIDELLRLSVETKLDVVERDTHDASLRLSLNLGHTFGHALEAAEPDCYAHGEAVAFGLIASAWMSRHLGIIGDERLGAIVSSALPFTLRRDAPHSIPRLIAAMEADKKRSSGGLRFVLPTEAAGVEIRTVTEKEIVAEAVEYAFGRIEGGG